MAIMRVGAFGGMQPILDPTLLPPDGSNSTPCATQAENTWLYSGAAYGLPTPEIVKTLSRPDIGKVYRIPRDYNVPVFKEPVDDSYWMEFENFDTDVVRSPTFGEEFDRYYWASTTGPPQYNTRERIIAGDPAWKLGVPTPETPPTVKHKDGDSGIPVTRAYVYTWLTDYKEEGAPSPPTLVTADAGDTWTITCSNPPADPTRNITKYRIYRTVTSSSGVPLFYLVGEFDLPVVKFIDRVTDNKLVGATALESMTWTPPPEDLVGFCMMPNGILAGWRGSEMWFSEAYRPHAWPAAHVQLTEYPIVGMGIYNQTLVVCTQGFPVAAYGTTPLAIVTSKLTLFEPCTSRGSIISSPEGVYYASAHGLVLVADQAQVVTAKLIARDQWQALQKRVKFRAARLGNAYYGWGVVTAGAFQPDAFQNDAYQMTDATAAQKGFYLDLSEPRVGINVLSSPLPLYGCQNDTWTDDVLLLRGGNVERIDQSHPGALPEPYIWASKLFQTAEPRNYAAMKVYFTVPAGTPDPPVDRDTALVQTLGSKWGVIRFYCDNDELISTHELRESGELLRLPGDRKYDFCWFQLEARVRIRSVLIASTTKELASV